MTKVTAGLKPIDMPSITSAHTVLSTLQSLSDSLQTSELSSLIPFNKAYVVVTQTMCDAIDAKAFTNPAIIDSFVIAFARYYFQVINDLLAKKHVTPAWQATASPNHQKRPAFIGLLLGANAHINYDLPLALNKVLHGQSPDLLYKDLRTVDRLIMRGSKRVLDTFEEPYPQAAYIKQHGKVLYFRPVMYSILYWRFSAWRNHTKLYENTYTKAQLERRSTKIADRLERLGKQIDKDS